jgi:hypothetical protein
MATAESLAAAPPAIPILAAMLLLPAAVVCKPVPTPVNFWLVPDRELSSFFEPFSDKVA